MTTQEPDNTKDVVKYTICRICGNLETNHRYRHLFEGVTVKDTTKRYVLNADDFVQKSVVRCGFENCNGMKENHNSVIISKHEFVPKEFPYREIKLAVLPTESCAICQTSLENHRSQADGAQTHRFSVALRVKNKKEEDKVIVYDPTDDERIIDIVEKREKSDKPATSKNKDVIYSVYSLAK